MRANVLLYVNSKEQQYTLPLRLCAFGKEIYTNVSFGSFISAPFFM